MKMKNFRCSVLAFFTVFCLASALWAAQPAPDASEKKADWPMHLRFLSGPNGGQWFFMGTPIAEILSAKVLPTSSRIGGGVDNINSINKKTGDLAFTLNCFIGASGSGEEEYQEIRLDNTTILANIYPQVLYVLIRRDFADKNGIDSVASLMEKEIPLRFASLRPGTASEFILALLLKYGYGKTFADLEKQGWSVSFGNYAEIADNLVAGDLDCFAYTAGTDVPLIHTIEEHTEVLILPVERSVLDALAAKFKTGTYVIEPGDYKNAKAPIVTLGDYTCIIVRKDLPDDLAYAMAKTLWEGRDSVAKVIGDFGGLDPKSAVPQGLPMHPGALRFWEELRASSGAK